MTTKSFGYTLIIVGVFVAFILFSNSHWHSGRDFVSNLARATLFETDITLGHGLLIPLAAIAIGIMISKNIIHEKHVRKFLPFLESNDQD